MRPHGKSPLDPATAKPDPAHSDRLAAGESANDNPTDCNLAQQLRPGRAAPDTDRREFADSAEVAGGQEPSTSAAVVVQPTAFGRETRPRIIKLSTKPCAHVT
jgi:hypothetical protein